MRNVALPALYLLLVSPFASAQLPPETVGRTVLPEPQASWFMINGWDDAYIFDAADGEMKGLISHNFFTPAIVTLPSRKEAYLVESFYARGVSGERSDVLTVVDMGDLTTKAEIDIPEKAAALPFRHHIGLLNDERHVVVFNMTPAQSVSVVDIVDREFAGEISTAGCAMIMPTGARSFLMICGDGRLQLIELNADGKEADRVRTEVFFNVEQDAVYDRPVQTAAGWLLISYEGLARSVSVDGKRITIGDAWSLLGEKDRQEKWRPGGAQPFTIHRASNLLYVLMHQGEIDTPDEDGTEVWVFDTERHKRVARLKLPLPASHILSSQEEAPRLYVYAREGKLQIYDGRRLRLQRTIEEPGGEPGLLQTLTPYD